MSILISQSIDRGASEDIPMHPARNILGGAARPGFCFVNCDSLGRWLVS